MREIGPGRLWWTVGLIAAGATVGAVLVGTGALRPEDSGRSAEEAAQQRCRSEVMNRLISADRSTISDLRARVDNLDVDGRDFSSLTASEPLKGIDSSRVTVVNVSGSTITPSEVGSTIEDHFDCRAYFVGGEVIHTLVVFDHGH